MKIRSSLICVFLGFSLLSCKCMVECFPEFRGKVLSNSTKEPIEGATVQLVNQNITVKTDKDRFFKLSASGCIDGHLRISKEHYKPFEITFSSSSNSKSYKVKSESTFVDYDKPFYLNPKDTSSSFTIGTWINQNSESFSVSSDKLIYYLDTLKSVPEEISDIQNQIRKSFKK
jgi:hypothetical protein